MTPAQSDSSTVASVTKAAAPATALSQKLPNAHGEAPEDALRSEGASQKEFDCAFALLQVCANGVRVRTAAGSLVLSLGAEEIGHTNVSQLKSKVLDVVGRNNQMQLIVGTRELKDSESLSEVELVGEVLEILLVTSQVPQLDPDTPVDEQKETLKGMIMSFSPEYQLDGATLIRKLLSAERDPPIQDFIDLGVVPRLLALGAGQDGATPPVQFEALWGLTNIASGSTEQTQAVV